jgi:hypothetical protein
VLEPDHLPLPKKRAPSGGTAVWRPASTRPYSSERAVRPLPLLHVPGEQARHARVIGFSHSTFAAGDPTTRRPAAANSLTHAR